MDKHDLVSQVKLLTEKLGHTPNRMEFELNTRGARKFLERLFNGSYEELLDASGLDRNRSKRKDLSKPELTDKQILGLEKRYRQLCSKREQIQGFFRSTLDLKEMFERAGNPPSLKISAQPDTHAKFVDKPAFNSYLKFLQYYKPHAHIIMGDFVDCEGLSHWPADDLEPRRIVPEMKVARELLQKLVDVTPQCSTRIYLTGNHEAWIEQAFSKMPELFDGLAELDIEISLKTLLGLPKFGYDLFPLNEIVQIGKANFTHGLYTGASHAAAHLKKLKCNLYYAHLHDTQETNETSIDGPMEAATFGCLCKLDAKFLKGKPNNWVHGHAVFEFFPDGSYTWFKVRIFNGKTSFNGIVFDGNKEPLIG